MKNALDGGFVVGVTGDPGGPGGSHTAGVLGAIPLRRDLYKPEPGETGPVAGSMANEEMRGFRAMQAQFGALKR